MDFFIDPAWVALFFVFLLTIYMMVIIRREKQTYLTHSSAFLFDDFILYPPSWWEIKNQETGYLSFERADTFYEWVASFQTKELEKVASLKKRLEDLKIILDHDSSKMPSFSCELDSEWEYASIEGTGTQDSERRIFYQGKLFTHRFTKKKLLCESLSSVLNGGLEGPYFEEVLKRIKRAE